MTRLYLDWNATAPLRPEAKAAMVAAMEVVGNPSSVHAEGRATKSLMERAIGYQDAGATSTWLIFSAMRTSCEQVDAT